MLGGLALFRAVAVAVADAVDRAGAVAPGARSGSGLGLGAAADGGGALLGAGGGGVPAGVEEATEGSWTATGCSNTVSTSTACTPSQDNATAAPVAAVQAPS
ncbi:hypothetical protein [Kitasatospora sp. NPDC088783]|uniref:hypothetical protein n=1 Tax=Kitasatospora sp. NPDC088783 TaxID=3364077 RepID=UPI0037F7214E